MSRTRQYLQDLAREVELVARFTRDGKAAFLADERTQHAVMMADPDTCNGRVNYVITPLLN